jgi:hypothetical protein
MSKQNPAYRGIYARDATNKPANPPKQSPKYRGIYTYVVSKKPDGSSATPPIAP